MKNESNEKKNFVRTVKDPGGLLLQFTAHHKRHKLLIWLFLLCLIVLAGGFVLAVLGYPGSYWSINLSFAAIAATFWALFTSSRVLDGDEAAGVLLVKRWCEVTSETAEVFPR